MNMYLIIMEGKHGAIDSYDSSCRGYHVIKFSSSTYTLQTDLSADGQVISYVEMVFEGTYFFPININYCYYVFQKTKFIITFFSLRTTINDSVNVIYYG